jgi:hypothetical protein
LSRDFIFRDVCLPPSGETRYKCRILDMLIVTRPSSTLLMVLVKKIVDYHRNYLKLFDVDSWECVSMCEVTDSVCKLFQVGDDICMYGRGKIIRVTPVIPLAVTDDGSTSSVNYDCLAVLDQHTILGIFSKGSCQQQQHIHLLSPDGTILRKYSRCFQLNDARVVTSRNRIVALQNRSKLGSHLDPGPLGRDHVMCMTVSEGGDISFNWTSTTLPDSIVDLRITRTSGVIIATCKRSVLILDLNSGTRLQRISCSPISVSEISNTTREHGMAVYGTRMFAAIYGDEGSAVAEFQIQGMFILSLQM